MSFIAGSPREVLREAFQADLISDDAWMEMLKVRNELTHVSCIIKIPIIAEGSPQSCRGNFPIIAEFCLVFS